MTRVFFNYFYSTFNIGFNVAVMKVSITAESQNWW